MKEVFEFLKKIGYNVVFFKKENVLGYIKYENFPNMGFFYIRDGYINPYDSNIKIKNMLDLKKFLIGYFFELENTKSKMPPNDILWSDVVFNS